MLDELFDTQEEKAIKEAELRIKKEELSYARQVQLSMLPKENIRLPNLNIVGFMQTATEVGGDYYDFFNLDESHYVVVLGDATGHGVGAGMMVGMVKSALNQALKRFDANKDSLSGLMSTLNETLREAVSQRGLGMCLSISIVNPQTGELKVISTGLPYPYLFESSNGNLQPVTINGPPLGLMRELKIKSISLTLAPGDSLILLSDGFPERMDHEDRVWGYEKLEEVLLTSLQKSENSDAVIGQLKEENDLFAAGRENDDDMTVVIIRRI